MLTVPFHMSGLPGVLMTLADSFRYRNKTAAIGCRAFKGMSEKTAAIPCILPDRIETLLPNSYLTLLAVQQLSCLARILQLTRYGSLCSLGMRLYSPASLA